MPDTGYEGQVRFADGRTVSLQCFEDRHGACPQPDDSDELPPEFGPLEGGYHCECSCHGAATPGDSPLQRELVVTHEAERWQAELGRQGGADACS